MALTVETQTNADSTLSGVTSLTASHTTTSGVGMVIVRWWLASSTWTGMTATWNGASMTSIGSQINGAGYSCGAFYILTTAAVTANCVVSWSTSSAEGTIVVQGIHGASWAPDHSTGVNSSSATPWTLPITSDFGANDIVFTVAGGGLNTWAETCTSPQVSDFVESTASAFVNATSHAPGGAGPVASANLNSGSVNTAQVAFGFNVPSSNPATAHPGSWLGMYVP